MDKIKSSPVFKAKDKSERKGEGGFSYIETVISMVILIVGLLGVLSAMTYAVLYAREAERKTQAKELAGSFVENVFAIRDIQSQGGLAIKGWNAVQIQQNNNGGIFINGWFPIREGPGADGIYGTSDDSCAAGGNCTGVPIVPGFERDIDISDITENGVVRKRRIDVKIRYSTVGNTPRMETVSTIIANLPIN